MLAPAPPPAAGPPAPGSSAKALPFHKVVVHPLVLLSVVDHYTRVAKDTRKRVVGVLLGEIRKGQVDVTNSFAVPFEEDDSDSSIWFLDHNYLEAMFHMYKRINAKEVVVGWYSSGPTIRASDMEINELLRRYCADPVMCVVDVNPTEEGIPTKSYLAIEEVKPESAEKSARSFVHVQSEVGAYEAEEIGVEHLLRDVKDATVSTLAVEVAAKLGALKGLHARLREMKAYLEDVAAGKLPVKHDILGLLQDLFNSLPNLNVEELVKSFASQTNDMSMAVYLAAIVRAIIALHNLINNRQEMKQWEKDADKKEKEKETEKEKEKGKAGEKEEAEEKK